MPRHLDLLALSASVVAAAVTLLYLYLSVVTEHDHPSWWALCVLLVGIGGAGYAVRMAVPYRRVALVVSAVCLIALGYLALLSIGLPLLLAGALCVAAALRARPAKDWRDMV